MPTKNIEKVQQKDMPIACPTQNNEIWCSHPKVYIQFENNKGKCPYCGTNFELCNDDK